MTNEREYRVRPHNLFYTILTRDCSDKDPDHKEIMFINEHNDKILIEKFPISEMENIVNLASSEHRKEELENYEFVIDNANELSIRKDPSIWNNYVLSMIGGYEESPECSLTLTEIRGLFGTLKR